MALHYICYIITAKPHKLRCRMERNVAAFAFNDTNISMLQKSGYIKFYLVNSDYIMYTYVYILKTPVRQLKAFNVLSKFTILQGEHSLYGTIKTYCNWFYKSLG